MPHPTSEPDASTIAVTKDQFIYQYEKRRDPYENQPNDNDLQYFKQFVKSCENEENHVHENVGEFHFKNQKEKLKKMLIFRNMDPWRIKWDMFIIFLSIYNSICLPL